MPDEIVAEALEYRVSGATIVSRVDVSVSAGEVVAIIGPNGAGKSTVLGLLAGDLRPTAGRVLVGDVDVAGMTVDDLSRTRAVLSQRLAVDVPFTAAQVVAMGRFPHRRQEGNSRERDEAAVTDAMRRTDTLRFASRIYATLSGGERTRVSVARVLAQDTAVVLLDEPTTALDVANQERIMQQVRHLAAAGRTVVTVLHDLNAAAFHADRLVLMDRGTVAASGSASQVLTADRLSAVYGQAMHVVEHPFRACPLVLVAD